MFLYFFCRIRLHQQRWHVWCHLPCRRAAVLRSQDHSCHGVQEIQGSIFAIKYEGGLLLVRASLWFRSDEIRNPQTSFIFSKLLFTTITEATLTLDLNWTKSCVSFSFFRYSSIASRNIQYVSTPESFNHLLNRSNKNISKPKIASQ